jgi:phasin family protein
MASKSHKPRTSRESHGSAANEATSTQDVALAFSQDQLQALIGLTDVVFQCSEEMRRCQMEAAQEAHEEHRRAQAKVAKASSPAESFNLQSELLRFDMEAASKYWQQLAAICAATQANAMSVFTRSAAAVGGDVVKLMANPPAAAALAPNSSASPEGTVAAADPSQAWNQWVDLSKQWTGMLYRNEAALH